MTTSLAALTTTTLTAVAAVAAVAVPAVADSTSSVSALVAAVPGPIDTAGDAEIETSMTARPKRSSGYLVVGTHAGVDGAFGGDERARLGLHLEAGTRLGTSSVLLRGQLAYGAGGVLSDSTYAQARAGIESRRCTSRGGACASVGVDLGYTRDVRRPETLFPFEPVEYYENVEHRLGLIPRASAEIGGPVRLRFGLEMPISQRLASGHTPASGLVLSVGTGYAF